MEKELEVEVSTISMETIKSSLPPSSHPETFNLSLPDRINLIYHMPVLLFYTANAPRAPSEVDISGLKISLSQTLDQFYPLAGRLLDESTISCKNQGVPFIETNVNCRLSCIFNSPHKLKLLTKFLPPQKLRAPGPLPIHELVPLAFQVNVFLCGGVVIGCYVLHKFIDAASLGTLLKHWSTLASKRSKDLVPPNFEASVRAFPVVPKVKHISEHNFEFEVLPTRSNSLVVVKSFIFNADAIRKLKTRAICELLPTPTKFEAVAGFIWEHFLASTFYLGEKFDHSTLSIAVNMRPRMNPPLPWSSMGNIVATADAQTQVAVDSNSPRLQELAKEIHSAISDVNQKISRKFNQGEDAAELIFLEQVRNVQGSLAAKRGSFRVTSWCNLGLDEADFGFGKPVWIVPVDGYPLIKNLFVLTDHSHPITGHGIEAWMLMEEKEMKNLVSNPDFLAFASPN